MATVIYREQLPDGTVKLWFDDNTTRVVGTPIDPVARATQAGQAAAAQTRAQYADPWYQTNVLDPMNRSTEQQAKDRARQLNMQADQLKLQGRIADANILYQQAQIELRKDELRQSGMLQAAGMLANARGAGNAAQRISLGERLAGFGAQTQGLADIAAGRVPQGAFAMRPGDKPVSEADYLSGMLGATQDQMRERDRNDRALAAQIGSTITTRPRGSLEALGPYRQAYLGSYLDAEGFDAGYTEEEYRRAGIHQGRG